MNQQEREDYKKERRGFHEKRLREEDRLRGNDLLCEAERLADFDADIEAGQRGKNNFG